MRAFLQNLHKKDLRLLIFESAAVDAATTWSKVKKFASALFNLKERYI